MRCTNKAELVGTVETKPIFEYEAKNGMEYGSILVSSRRLSGTKDTIIVMAPMYRLEMFEVGDVVDAIGEFSSFNELVDNKKHLKLYLSARTIDFCNYEDYNYITLSGYICKKPIFRKTPTGRSIVDVIMAVNRSSSNPNYIPVIFWGILADSSCTLNVGDRIVVEGRMQSREYYKDGVVHTVYEISANSFDKI